MKKLKKKNESLELMKQIYNEPQTRGRKTFRECLIDLLCDLAMKEDEMRDLMKTNPEMYQFTMKVALEEQARRERKIFDDK